QRRAENGRVRLSPTPKWAARTPVPKPSPYREHPTPCRRSTVTLSRPTRSLSATPVNPDSPGLTNRGSRRRRALRWCWTSRRRWRRPVFGATCSRLGSRARTSRRRRVSRFRRTVTFPSTRLCRADAALAEGRSPVAANLHLCTGDVLGHRGVDVRWHRHHRERARVGGCAHRDVGFLRVAVAVVRGGPGFYRADALPLFQRMAGRFAIDFGLHVFPPEFGRGRL